MWGHLILVESNTSIYLILEQPPAPKFMLVLCFLSFCALSFCVHFGTLNHRDMTYHNLVVSPCGSTGRCIGAGFKPGYHDGAMLKMGVGSAGIKW